MPALQSGGGERANHRSGGNLQQHRRERTHADAGGLRLRKFLDVASVLSSFNHGIDYVT